MTNVLVFRSNTVERLRLRTNQAVRACRRALGALRHAVGTVRSSVLLPPSLQNVAAVAMEVP